METQGQTNSNDFIQYLQNELLLRCRNNTNYSMRAYAKQLGINQSLLSKILRGKRSISKKMILELSKVLKVSKSNLSRFLNEGNKTTSSFKKAQLLRDQFELLSDWYHFAILELTHLKYFKPDPKWISSTLGITIAETNIAIDRLMRNDYIKIHPNGKWQIFKPHNNWSHLSVTNSARKLYQRQILEKAIQAIQEVDFDFRYNTSMTMAIDISLIPKIKELLDKYRDDLTEYAEQNGSYTDIYQLCMGFFPLTNTENKRSKK